MSRVRFALWHEANLRLNFEEVDFAHSGQKEEACVRAGSCPAMTRCELSDSSRDSRAVDVLKCVPAANQIEPFIHEAINAPNSNVFSDEIYQLYQLILCNHTRGISKIPNPVNEFP